jgi:hypothetical protein
MAQQVVTKTGRCALVLTKRNHTCSLIDLSAQTDAALAAPASNPAAPATAAAPSINPSATNEAQPRLINSPAVEMLSGIAAVFKAHLGTADLQPFLNGVDSDDALALVLQRHLSLVITLPVAKQVIAMCKKFETQCMYAAAHK